MELADEHRRVRRRRRPARRASCSPSGAPPSRSCRCGCSAGGCSLTTTLHRARRRRHPHRARPRTCRPTSRTRSASSPLVGGPGARRADPRLAARPPAFSGRLFYLRLGFRPTVLIGLGLVVARRGCARPARPDARRWPSSPSPASSSGSGWASSPTPIADRRPGQRRVGRARRRDRHQHVRPLDRQRGGRGRVRRGRERGRRPRPAARPNPEAVIDAGAAPCSSRYSSRPC